MSENVILEGEKLEEFKRSLPSGITIPPEAMRVIGIPCSSCVCDSNAMEWYWQCKVEVGEKQMRPEALWTL